MGEKKKKNRQGTDFDHLSSPHEEPKKVEKRKKKKEKEESW